MLQISRVSWSVVACAGTIGLAMTLPEISAMAQEQAPVAAPAGGAGGRGPGGGRGFGPTITQQPNYQLFEYSCHEGNGAVGYALSGGRAYEEMVADATAKGLPIPPRSMGMEVYSGGQVEGRQPVRELGGAK